LAVRYRSQELSRP